MAVSISEQCEVIWFLIGEGELNMDSYQGMGSFYGEYCLVRTTGAKVFVKGGKRYQISITIVAQTFLVKPRKSLKISLKKFWNTHRIVQICLPKTFHLHLRENFRFHSDNEVKEAV
ncbi:hypothetical protein TNCV_4714371 [Trichonephila clavipes]|nr:hypothetical protein TNCV_4714371 [Trichonephila clavipes]